MNCLHFAYSIDLHAKNHSIQGQKLLDQKQNPELNFEIDEVSREFKRFLALNFKVQKSKIIM